MIEIKTLQDILIIEDHPEILNFRCPDTGYLLWPLIRNTFTRFIVSDLLYETPLASDQRQPRPGKAAGLAILKTFVHNAIKGNLRGDILISCTGAHILREGGLHFNRLSDDFALLLPEKTVTMEALFFDWNWPFPRINGKVLFDTPVLAFSFLAGKFCVRKKHLQVASALVDFVNKRSQEYLGWELSKQQKRFLVVFLSKKCAAIPAARLLYARIFKKTRARLLLRQLGVYEGSFIINTVAKENGLITAEYQHGSVSSGHDAYNFSKTLCQAYEYRKTLPQFFLSYGTWWGDQINLPCKKICIGNPYRTEILKDINMERKQRTDILVLGDGVETEKYLALCSSLENAIGDKYRVVFRPHPWEREAVAAKYGKKRNQVYIEWKKELYNAFTSTDILVSEISTGLFEAIGLVQTIFLWETKKSRFCYPSHPFSTFESPEELVQKIQSGGEGTVSPLVIESIWAPDWEKNYRNFLDDVLS